MFGGQRAISHEYLDINMPSLRDSKITRNGRFFFEKLGTYMGEGVGIDDGGKGTDLVADCEALGLGAQGKGRGRFVDGDCDGVGDLDCGRGGWIRW